MYLAWISRALLLGCASLGAVSRQQSPLKRSLADRAAANSTARILPRTAGCTSLYATQGRKAEADQVFLVAVNALPAEAFSGANSPRALAIGDFYLACGKLDLALEQYRTGMAANPADKTTYLKRQIEALLRQGKRSEAGELNAQLLRESPDDIDARITGASMLLDKGDVNGAWAGLTALAIRAPENPVLHYNLGRALTGRGEADAAMNEFRRAIELYPDYVPARLALAQLQVARGQFDEAREDGRRYSQVRRTAIPNARLIQSSALWQKKFAEARQSLDDALKKPRIADVDFQLGALSLAERNMRRQRRLSPSVSTEPRQSTRPDGKGGNRDGTEPGGCRDSADPGGGGQAPSRAELHRRWAHRGADRRHEVAIASSRRSWRDAERLRIRRRRRPRMGETDRRRVTPPWQSKCSTRRARCGR